MDAADTRAHTTLFLPAEAAMPLDEIRRRYDPVFAGQMGVHATLTYPDEAPDARLLAQRLDELARWSGPFPLRLAEIAVYGDSAGGVHVRVEDVSGAYVGARAQLLAPPFSSHGVEAAVPHVTLVHPLTSDRGPDAWADLAGLRLDVDVVVDRVSLIAFDGIGWPATKVVRLAGPAW